MALFAEPPSGYRLAHAGGYCLPKRTIKSIRVPLRRRHSRAPRRALLIMRRALGRSGPVQHDADGPFIIILDDEDDLLPGAERWGISRSCRSASPGPRINSQSPDPSTCPF